MKVGSLGEESIKRLRAPAKGNSVTYFAGATIQGAKAPRGFGVRVTASGARAFILNYRLRGREHRFTIGAWPDWTALRAVREARNLRQRVDRGEDPLHLSIGCYGNSVSTPRNRILRRCQGHTTSPLSTARLIYRTVTSCHLFRPVALLPKAGTTFSSRQQIGLLINHKK
jgi:hypothetical protein